MIWQGNAINCYAVNEGLREVGSFNIGLQKLMDVLVIEGVFDIAVQVTYVCTRLNSEFLFYVFRPDEFTALLPFD